MPLPSKKSIEKKPAKVIEEEEEDVGEIVAVPKKKANGSVKSLAKATNGQSSSNGAASKKKREVEEEDQDDQETQVIEAEEEEVEHPVKKAKVVAKPAQTKKPIASKEEVENEPAEGGLVAPVKRYASGKEFYAGESITLVNINKNEVEPVLNFDAKEHAEMFPPFIQKHISNMGYTTPSPIQSVTWPLAFQGRDITGIAITGSGKTFAFLLAPMVALQKELSATPAASFAGRRMTSWTAKPRILVLSPTRELTNQIFEHADKLCSAGGIGLKAAVVYGGADPWQQKRALPGTNVLIATPGRLTDFMKRGTIDLSEVSTVILDEADRMMDMGFEPQIREILSGVPAERQTLMFSATWPKSVRQISEQFFNNPVQVWIGSTQLNANPRITQEFEIILPSQLLEKLDAALPALLKEGKGLIFCNRKGSVDELVHELKNARYKAAGIHGDKLQSDRESTLHNFNMGKWNIVVGTDVAARGLDFKDVGWVINADFPNNIEDYVHRIGRTARAGKYGKSITYLDKNDPPNLHKAKKLIKILNQAKQQVPPEVLQFLRVAPEEDSWSRRGRRGGRGGGWGGNRNGGGWGNNRNGGGGGWGNSGGGYNNNNGGGYNNNNGGDYHSGNGGGYSNGGGYGNSNGGSWGKSNGGDYGSGGGYGNGGGYSSGGGFSNGGGRGGGRGGFGGRGGRGGRGGFGSGGDF